MKKEQIPDNTVKKPEDWKTGDEPLTGAQASYLETLASEAHEEIDTDLQGRGFKKN